MFLYVWLAGDVINFVFFTQCFLCLIGNEMSWSIGPRGFLAIPYCLIIAGSRYPMACRPSRYWGHVATDLRRSCLRIGVRHVEPLGGGTWDDGWHEWYVHVHVLLNWILLGPILYNIIIYIYIYTYSFWMHFFCLQLPPMQLPFLAFHFIHLFGCYLRSLKSLVPRFWSRTSASGSRCSSFYTVAS